MNLQLVRKYFKPDYTIGRLLINGQPFCDTLEDRYRDLSAEPKIAGQTAIPYGLYRVVMSYSDRFGRIMPEVLEVPYFRAIRLHSGNTEANTEGCPLVGKNDVVGALTRSRYYSDELNKKILEVHATENVWLEIVQG